MRLHLLYPCNPLRRQEPDELYREEHAAAYELDFGISLFPFEEFLAGHFRAQPSLPARVSVLYRGWMLTVPDYARLHSQILTVGATPVTSPEQYQRCHYLPGWYSQLKEFTPVTHFFEESEDIAARLCELGWANCFLKDHVKSLSVKGGSMVSDLATIPNVLEKMKSYRGEIEGGLCARQIEQFEPATEERYFVFRGKPFSRSVSIPEMVHVAAARIDSPFFTIDTVVRRDGVVRIVELGDGQVSDRKKWSARQLLEILKR